MAGGTATSTTQDPEDRRIPVQFQHTGNFPDILQQLGCSLVVSTYQAGKVLVLGAHGGKLTISLLDYERPMGVAVGQNKIAIGAGASIHFLTANHAAAPTVAPAGSHDGCYVPHTSRHTGKILVHDLGWGTEGLWLVNTLFSCLCTLDDSHSFIPRWKPGFISALADEDRCHLNGMAMDQGQPRYVTCLAPVDTAAGWRADKARTGCLIDVQTGEFVARGLCMPHSPRVARGELFVLNSGYGNLSRVDRATGRLEPVEQVPGYTRGLAFHGQFAFVGLSRIRETNVFGGLPIGEHREELCCGVAAIDMTTGRTVATFRFLSGVEEIFAVEVLPGFGNPALGGALHGEQQNEIWIVPSQPPALRLPPPSAAPFSALVAPQATPSPASPLPGTGAPPSSATLRRSAQQAYQAGRLREALQLYQQALQLDPRDAEMLCDLGNLYQELDDRNAAFECYRQSVELQPRQALTQRNLGVLYLHRNQPTQALRHFELAQQAEPHPLNLVLAAKALPVIYKSTEDVAAWRDRVAKCLANLVEAGVTVDTTSSFITTNFHFAYQGENDRPLMEHVGKIYRGVECCPAARAGGWKPRGKRLRVGFASAYFCQHTIGLLNLGLIQRLPRDRFEVTVIALRKNADVWSESFRKGADHYVEVPRQPARARQAIAELNLDILIFADVGMDALAQTLCYSRMAPLQALTWGHPDTTGSPTLDRFISTDLAEAADAQDHYTEKLVRLPNLGVCYERPVLDGPRRSRAQFGLDPNRRVYLCPQTLFKFHPEFDEPLRRILEADPGGDLVLVAGSNPEWIEALRQRWRTTLPDADRRVKFLPGVPRVDFLHLLAMADVMLDPFPFCGGNTSLEGFAMGTPIVTLPGKYLRGRLTYGMYRRMGLEELVPNTVAAYAEQAVRLATDPTTRRQHSEAILQACPRLYDSQEDVLAWADALEAMVAEVS
jgi:uncharacterized protein (TIGR03032 family)